MLLDLLEVFIPVIALIANGVVQVFAVRFVPGVGLLRSIIVGYFAGLATVFLFNGYLIADLTLDLDSYLIFNLTTYTALSYCYFHFINLGETARRIRILNELSLSKQGLTKNELLKKYNARIITDKRLHRLLSNGQIVKVDGFYRIGKPTVLLIAKLLSSFKKFLLGESF